MRPKVVTAILAGVAACAIAGFGAGAAVAAIPAPSAPVGITSTDDAHVSPAVPDYPVNSEGLTYGSAGTATSPETEPDLIRVVATNGKTGYAKRSDLRKAEGPTDFASPQDALAWQAAIAGKDSVVPVYRKNGTTVIGTFVIHHPTGIETAGTQQAAAGQ